MCAGCHLCTVQQTKGSVNWFWVQDVSYRDFSQTVSTFLFFFLSSFFSSASAQPASVCVHCIHVRFEFRVSEREEEPRVFMNFVVHVQRILFRSILSQPFDGGPAALAVAFIGLPFILPLFIIATKYLSAREKLRSLLWTVFGRRNEKLCRRLFFPFLQSSQGSHSICFPSRPLIPAFGKRVSI